MAKKKKIKKKKKDYTLVIILTIITFYSVYLLTSGDDIFQVELIDNSTKNVLHTQSLKVTRGVILSQQVFKNEVEPKLIMQSTEPIEEDETIAIFRAIAINPFKEQAELEYATIYKNGIPIVPQDEIHAYLGPGEQFIYKTPEIDLVGKEAQLNFIIIELYFKQGTNTTEKRVYEYLYYTLTPCSTDSVCNPPETVCDKGNVGRFSTDPDKHYCVKTCVSNDDCHENQVCIKGFCGY